MAVGEGVSMKLFEAILCIGCVVVINLYICAQRLHSHFTSCGDVNFPAEYFLEKAQ